MAKHKPKPPQTRAPSAKTGVSWHLAKTAAKALLALGLAVGLLVGLSHLGDRAATEVVPHPRYTVAFADIETAAPPGRDRKTFLTEVRFLGDLPETLQSVDPNLGEHLKAAFRKHPWVLDVGGVAVVPPGIIRADVKFREPALAVKIGTGSEVRVLDRTAVLLPADAASAKLPVLVNRLVPAGVAAGQKWPDPDVQRAVELVLLYPCEKIERILEGWQIGQANGKVVRIAAP
jgi:hypothetical protein